MNKKKEILRRELSDIIVKMANVLDNLHIDGYDIKILKIGEPDEYFGEYDLLLTAKIAFKKR